MDTLRDCNTVLGIDPDSVKGLCAPVFRFLLLRVGRELCVSVCLCVCFFFFLSFFLFLWRVSGVTARVAYCSFRDDCPHRLLSCDGRFRKGLALSLLAEGDETAHAAADRATAQLSEAREVRHISVLLY
eukprot:COSAG01_NODE_12103_length_1800_cov_4.370958_2_plen_129_part_00